MKGHEKEVLTAVFKARVSNGCIDLIVVHKDLFEVNVFQKFLPTETN